LGGGGLGEKETERAEDGTIGFIEATNGRGETGAVWKGRSSAAKSDSFRSVPTGRFGHEDSFGGTSTPIFYLH
jgi:hypothetical protein